MEKSCIILFSGGLDSQLVVKIMQKRKLDLFLVFFKLPFNKDVEEEVNRFSKENNLKLKIFDCTKGKPLQKYLKTIKEAKHGRGTGVNPCIDCKIFMLKKTRKFAKSKNIELIATGEVLGQRPMSQTKRAIEVIENKSGLKNKIIRPISDFGAFGRKREKQIALAKEFKISYPNPAGGCLLCEKELKKRLKYLLDRGLDNKEIKLVNIGRHFLIEGIWVVLGRNKKENEILKEIGKKKGELIVPEFIGPSVLVMDKHDDHLKKKINELTRAYSKIGNLEKRRKFEEYKL
jgi:tRNA-uridine 2-sulfurtransferase